MKTVGSILMIIALIMMIGQIKSCISANYEYEKEIGSFWDLADKSSTIPEKSKYIKQFVNALEKTEKSEYNAIWLKTPNNSFVKNLEALKSLESRLNQLKTMDINSFAYQTAIQQITAQEQGEAKNMLSVFEGCWTKDKYFIVWDWFGIVFGLIYVLILIVGFVVLMKGFISVDNGANYKLGGFYGNN
jgi:hypothetical protein